MGEANDSDDKPNNFQNFLQLQKQIIASIPDVEKNNNNEKLTTLSLDEIFKILEDNFNEFHDFTNLSAILPCIHRCLVLWAHNREQNEPDLGFVLFNFLQQHSNDENDLEVVVQIIHQFLNSIKSLQNNKVICLGKKVFTQLSQQLPTIKNRVLISSIIACLQQYINLFPENRTEVIKCLWSELSPRLAECSNSLSPEIPSINTEIEILLQLFDEIHEIYNSLHDDPTIVATTQQLLKSKQAEDRKFGHHLFRQMLHYLVQKFKNIGNVWITKYSSQNLEQMWTSYVMILENLEEQQAPLIINSLKVLPKLIESKQLQEQWLDILYMKILKHDNIEVLYWAMEFFLQTFTLSDLRQEVIKQLLETSNTTILYNYEGYCLKPQLFAKFLEYDLTNIYKILTDIEWKSIPFYIWIKALLDNKNVLPAISYEELLELSQKVCALENSIIRQEIIKMFEQIFETFIEKMSMKEYVRYVETLYSTNDVYDDFETFYNKKFSLIAMDTEEDEFIFEKRIYEIFVNNLNNSEIEVQKFIKFLSDIPQKYHGWLLLIPFHYYKQIENHNILILHSFYGMNLNGLQNLKLFEIIEIIKNNNNLCIFKNNFVTDSKDKEEFKMHCRMAAIAYYFQQKHTLDQEDDETFKTIFNAKLSKYNVMEKFTNLWVKLCECLNNTKEILDTWIIEEFFNRIDTKINKEVARNIMDYLKNVYDANDEAFEIVFNKYSHHVSGIFHQYANALKLSNQDLFVYEDIVKDNNRIEKLFCFNQFEFCLCNDNTLANKVWLHGISEHVNPEYISYLLKCHQDQTIKKPIYDCNSYEHFIKLRIAVAIYMSRNEIDCFIIDQIWDILLKENNQLNVCCFYEVILGVCDSRIKVILEKLNNSPDLTSSQQISIISVIHIVCMRQNLADYVTKEKIIFNLLTWTMCAAKVETRLFAQMVLYRLLSHKTFEDISGGQQILQSISCIKGLYENLNDVRLQMLEFYPSMKEKLLFVTNAQYDPVIFNNGAYFCSPEKYFAFGNISPETQEQLMKCRILYLEKLKISTAAATDEDKFQKKPNDIIMKSNNLTKYPQEESKNSEMIVVASLIDDLTLIKDLASNCKTLCISNIVVSTRNIITDKSLNITDVKPLDLKSYLIEKQQLQGFKIVGVERSSYHSDAFKNYAFPKKCILLLGHEKYGIPAPLTGLLHYAFKIPQVCQLDALNISNTGAFCMWKFFEQHLMKQNYLENV